VADLSALDEKPGEVLGLAQTATDTVGRTEGADTFRDELETMRSVVLPGVFRPRSDTWLLAETACRERLPGGARVLELCAGPALAGVAAAREHRASLTTVDVSRRAVVNAAINARLNGVRIRARHGNVFGPVAGERFDLILANPPYVPGPDTPARGAERAWEGGADGRAVLNRICAGAPAHLAPGGILLIVHSEVCDAGATLEALVAVGLNADVAARRRGPLGPLLRARRAALEARGQLARGQATEDMFVLRGCAAGPARGGSEARAAAGGEPGGRRRLRLPDAWRRVLRG
jgi:release factor glutamine methyltransferase